MENYTIFNQAKPGGDKFERVHAPILKKNRYEREINFAIQKVEAAKKKLEELIEAAESLPSDKALQEEIDRRVGLITKANKWVDSCMVLLDKFASLSKETDVGIVEKRQLIVKTVSDAYPKLEARMTALETRNQTELARLYMDNNKLTGDNKRFRDSVNNNPGAAQVSANLEAYLEGRIYAGASASASAELERTIPQLDETNRQSSRRHNSEQASV